MKRRGIGLFLLGGLLVAAGLVAFLSPRASQSPDGLQKVAEQQGLSKSEESHPLEKSPLAGYGLGGIEGSRAATVLSGLAGLAVAFGFGFLIFRLIGRRPGAAEREGPR